MLHLNQGRWDRAFRLALGVLFGSIAIVGAGGSAVTGVSTIMAVVLFATAAVGFCPLYTLLGIDTSGKQVEG